MDAVTVLALLDHGPRSLGDVQTHIHPSEPLATHHLRQGSDLGIRESLPMANCYSHWDPNLTQYTTGDKRGAK